MTDNVLAGSVSGNMHGEGLHIGKTGGHGSGAGTLQMKKVYIQI